jgi:hypothetical protein
MVKQSSTWRKSKGGHNRAEQGSRSEDRGQDRSRDQLAMATKPDSPVSKTGPSGFGSLEIEANFEDHRARDGSNTSLLSSMPHTQLEEEDPMNEGIKDEGRGS